MSTFKIQMPKEMFDPAQFMQINEEVNIDPIEVGPDTFIFSDPVRAEISVTNTGGAFLVQGKVSGEATCACARCLEDAQIDIAGTIEGYILIEGQDCDLDDLEGDEYEVLGDDKIVDMMPFIISAIMLDLPRIPLCSDTCKGICPKCGHNLNEGECECTEDEPDVSNNPFAVLKDIRFEN